MVDELLTPEFECSLCMKLLYQPVSIYCGHTFCKSCLVRTLDHSTKCPLCRQIIHIDASVAPTNVVLQSIIEKLFPDQLKERVEEEKGENDLLSMLPIFVLSVGCYPGQQFPMHIFEPRYRLMIRRALQGSQCFGLVSCGGDPNNKTYDVGCCLKVIQSHTLPDGRSLINTKGMKRFKILEKSTLDDYLVAKVKYFDDKIPSEAEKPKIYDLLKQVQQKSLRYLQIVSRAGRSSNQTDMQSIMDSVQDCPAFNDPVNTWSLYTFLTCSFLPAEDQVKQKLLSTDSVFERLSLLDRMLDKGMEDPFDCSIV